MTHPGTIERMRAALIARLQACKPGETYPLDPVERELVLSALLGRPPQIRAADSE